MKPVLKYPGSKWRIAGEIVARIPEHHTYLEPFFGSGAVFFSKEPSRTLAVCPDRQQAGTGNNKEVQLSGCFHVHRPSVYPGNQDSKTVQA